jgi:flagellar biosynthesis protein FliQ
MIDMHRSADGIETNLVEAIPYMYISFGNVVISAIWVAVIIAVFAAMRKVNSKTKARLEQQAKTVSGQIP